MTDIPATMTFDNLAAIALKELKAPLIIKLNSLEDTLESLRNEAERLENCHYAAVESLIIKQNKKFFNHLTLVSAISCDADFNSLKVSAYPNGKFDGSGSLYYTIKIKDSVMKKMPTWKAFNNNEKQYEKVHEEILLLKSKLSKLDLSVADVKEHVMEQFLANNPGHTGFKNFIRQRMLELSK